MRKTHLFSAWRESSHCALLKSFFLIGVLVLLGKSIGGAKEIAIAWRYGVSPVVDSYVLIFNMINWPVTIFSGVLMTALVPFGSELWRQSTSEARFFFEESLGWILFLSILLLLGVYILISCMIDDNWIGLGVKELQLAKNIYLPLLSTLFFNVLIVFFSPWILIVGKHWNTFAEMIPSVCILLTLIFLPLFFDPLVWGTVAGLFVQCGVLIFCLFFLNFPLRPRWTFASPGWPNFLRTLCPLLIIQVLMILPGAIDQIWVAHLGSGAISIFNYTNRLFSLLSSFAMVVIVRAMLPILSQKMKDPFVLRFTKQWMCIVFGFGLLLGCICLLYSRDIVHIFFERGEFTSSDSEKVAEVFRYSVCSLPFYFAFILGGQAFFVLNLYKRLIATYIAILIAKIVGNLFLVNFFSISAFMISNIFMYILGMLVLFVYLLGSRPSDYRLKG